MMVYSYDLENVRKLAQECELDIEFNKDGTIHVYDEHTEKMLKLEESSYEFVNYLEKRTKFIEEHNKFNWS